MIPAKESFQHAIELDPNFPLAYGRLGVAYGNLDQNELAEKFLKEALDRRMRLSERMYIESHFYCAAGMFERHLREKNMRFLEMDRLATEAMQCGADFQEGLSSDKQTYPLQQFRAFWAVTKR